MGEHDFEIDMKLSESRAANIKFTKRFQLQITYYTILVFFGIAFASDKIKNIENIGGVQADNIVIIFIAILFAYYTYIHLTCGNTLKTNRNQQNELEWYYHYRNRNYPPKRRENVNKFRDNIFLLFYLLIGGLGASLAIYSLTIKQLWSIVIFVELAYLEGLLCYCLFEDNKKKNKKIKYEKLRSSLAKIFKKIFKFVVKEDITKTEALEYLYLFLILVGCLCLIFNINLIAAIIGFISNLVGSILLIGIHVRGTIYKYSIVKKESIFRW